ncbi:uncharacterized protein [Clytia hemisphaerica]|uniref:Cnidarian restricted protein n=1 Tax=Clytia hemisphaerica TaxID=252671 RepID=A0A7M5X8X6_9CNID|eukprot:TCONS_00016320-protein
MATAINNLIFSLAVVLFSTNQIEARPWVLPSEAVSNDCEIAGVTILDGDVWISDGNPCYGLKCKKGIYSAVYLCTDPDGDDLQTTTPKPTPTTSRTTKTIRTTKTTRTTTHTPTIPTTRRSSTERTYPTPPPINHNEEGSGFHLGENIHNEKRKIVVFDG